MSKYFTYLNLSDGTKALKQLTGEDVSLDTANFDNNLSSSDDTVQKAFETLDELVISDGETVNIETISADKTLTNTDANIQILTTATGSYNIILPTSSVSNGKKFTIFNASNEDTSNSNHLVIKQDTTIIYTIDSRHAMSFRWDGDKWVSLLTSSISIGNGAYLNVSNGVGVGANANNNHTNGVGVGAIARNNFNYAVGVGYSATANAKQRCTVAIGAYSKAERNREIVSTATDDTTNKAQMTIQKFKQTDYENDTTTARELFIDANTSRLTIVQNSVYNFFGQINCYRTQTNDSINYPVGACKAWQFTGVIKRVGTTTQFVGTPVITILATDADAEIANIIFSLQADNTNDALTLWVQMPIGSGGRTYRFSCNIFASETRA